MLLIGLAVLNCESAYFFVGEPAFSPYTVFVNVRVRGACAGNGRGDGQRGGAGIRVCIRGHVRYDVYASAGVCG
jgi:hypothetical protein